MRKPRLTPFQELIHEAFSDLSTCRQSGFGIGPIPWTAIREYAASYEFDDTLDDLDEFVILIRRMDAVLMEHKRKEMENESGRRRT